MNGSLGLNWSSIREEYVTGSESIAAIAARYGLSRRTVENRALERWASDVESWGCQRRNFRESVAQGYRREAATMLAEAAMSIEEAQRRRVRDLVDRTVPGAVAALKNGDVNGADAVRAALAALQLQRELFGLDNAPTRLEVTGKAGARIEHDTFALGGLDEHSRAASKRVLEAIFGTAA